MDHVCDLRFEVCTVMEIHVAVLLVMASRSLSGYEHTSCLGLHFCFEIY
jgi:hypothetical protein